MKVRSLWPAIAGLLVLLALYLVMRGRDEPATAPAKPVDTRPAAPVAASGARPMEKPAVPAKPEVATDPAATVEDELARKMAQGSDESVATDPGMTAKKPKLTLDERLAEAQKHIPVIQRRAELLDKEIAELDQAGKTKEAAEQRIIVKRLRDHAEALRQAIAEHREPM